MSGDAKKDRATNQRFCDIEVLGTAAEMHGPNGVCTDCHGRGKS